MGALTKSLGGRQIDLGREFGVEDLSVELIRERVKRAELRRGLFVKVKGLLVSNDKEIPAYVHLNLSRSWRGVYGDMGLDAHARGDVSDPTDLVVRGLELRRILVCSLKRLSSADLTPMRGVYLGYGPNCIDDMRLLVVVCHDKGHLLIKDAFNTVELNGRARRLLRKIASYGGLLLRTIWEAVEGAEGFMAVLKSCRVVREEAKNLLLLAEEGLA